MFLYILPQSLLKILLCLAINVKQFSNLLIIIAKIGLLETYKRMNYITNITKHIINQAMQ